MAYRIIVNTYRGTARTQVARALRFSCEKDLLEDAVAVAEGLVVLIGHVPPHKDYRHVGYVCVVDTGEGGVARDQDLCAGPANECWWAF